MPDQAWSSGRILTSTQREEKRKKDRQLKRTQRQNIHKLEERIEKLENCLHTLLNQPPWETRNDPVSSIQASFSNSVATLATYDISGEDARAYDISKPARQTHPVGVCSFTEQLALASSPETDLPSALNFILGSVHEVDPLEVCFDKVRNHDAIIRGVMDGWAPVLNGTIVCPVWRILSAIDKSLTVHHGTPTRLCMMRILHWMLLYFVQPETAPDLPVWYRPRPCQLLFPHDVASDYFVWPGLRERLSVSQSPQLSNDFWLCFGRSIQFIWPYPLSLTSALDSNGVYSFTELFEKSLRDLRNYVLDPEFFSLFPQVYDDVVVFYDDPTQTG